MKSNEETKRTDPDDNIGFSPVVYYLDEGCVRCVVLSDDLQRLSRNDLPGPEAQKACR